MSFEKVLKSVQKQIEIDKKVFKKTGCLSELLMRIESFNRCNK